MPGRLLVALLMSGILLLAQLPLRQTAACSMCGAACKCASRASHASCSVRAAGCGGGPAGATIGSADSLRAILVASFVCAPRLESAGARPDAAHVLPSPVRAPLDHPPRLSC